MTPTTTAALRTVYLYTFDCFAVSPTEVADLPEVGNVRYARELLGTLVTAGLVSEQDVNGEETVWQTEVTYDHATREEAEATIDAWLATDPEFHAPAEKPARRQGKATKANPAGLPLCLCGCGTPGKSNYRPGHDARHAGNVAREVLAGKIAVTGILAAVHGSQALAQKVAAQVQRGNNKVANATSAKSRSSRTRHSLIGQAAWVKVGRWTYDGEVTSVTVDGKGKETPKSEVCVIEYKNGKGEIKHAQVDVAGAVWGMGKKG